MPEFGCRFVEGYWFTANMYGALLYPEPVARATPWSGQDNFARKLQLIERQPRVGFISTKGLCVSRLTGEIVPNGMFHNRAANICWTEALRPHYIVLNVPPSKQFYDYVMAFPNSIPLR